MSTLSDKIVPFFSKVHNFTWRRPVGQILDIRRGQVLDIRRGQVLDIRRGQARRNKASLAASPLTDDTFFPHGLERTYTDRTRYDRESILAGCLKAWRINPVARRVVKLYTQFVIGEGMAVRSPHKATQNFLRRWWNDEQNKLDEQIPEWMDELTRTGDLFILFSVDPISGMSYVRALPSESIKDIETAENDVRQELRYIPNDLNRPAYPAYRPGWNVPVSGGERQQPGARGLLPGMGGNGQYEGERLRTNNSADEIPVSFIIHYAVNRPVGCKFGEPDLAVMLPWMGRYANWLEDRARLNHFRQAFIFMLRGNFKDGAARQARQNEINANPPPAGSILVADLGDEWSVLEPHLASAEAAEDGLALKKMIAIGAGIPTHYLAEPESSTRTTAEAAGTPTFRGLEQMQSGFAAMLKRLAKTAVKMRMAAVTHEHLQADGIEVSRPDITERDNAILSLAVQRIYPALAELFDRDGIDEAELLRLVYRMAGETYPQEQGTPVMKKKRLQAAFRGAAPARPAEEASPGQAGRNEHPDENGPE